MNQVQGIDRIFGKRIYSRAIVTKTLTGPRRCMISQDRHEIYIIIATYTKEYVAYLQGDRDGSSGPFLTMHQIGPFIPNAERHMERLGRIIAALSRQLVHQAKNGNPCHW